MSFNLKKCIERELGLTGEQLDILFNQYATYKIAMAYTKIKEHEGPLEEKRTDFKLWLRSY